MPPPQPYYQDENCTIYHGDCADILPLLGKVDAIVTDPPYGINYNDKTKAYDTKDYGSFNWDTAAPSKAVFDLIRSISQYQIIFGGNYFELPPTRCLLIWDKKNGESRMSDAEIAWSNIDKAVRICCYMWCGSFQEKGYPTEKRRHSTQKPLAVMEWCINHLPIKNGLIVDPFMGSGTTLIVARNLGFKSIGIDQDLRYCEIAKKRLTGEIGLTVQEQKQVDARAAGQMNLLDLIGGS